MPLRSLSYGRLKDKPACADDKKEKKRTRSSSLFFVKFLLKQKCSCYTVKMLCSEDAVQCSCYTVKLLCGEAAAQ